MNCKKKCKYNYYHQCKKSKWIHCPCECQDSHCAELVLDEQKEDGNEDGKL